MRVGSCWGLRVGLYKAHCVNFREIRMLCRCRCVSCTVSDVKVCVEFLVDCTKHTVCDVKVCVEFLVDCTKHTVCDVKVCMCGSGCVVWQW